MKKVLKWTVIVVGVVYSLIVFAAPAGVLHLRHRESFGHSVLRSRQRVPRDWTHHSNAGSPWARGQRRTHHPVGIFIGSGFHGLAVQ